MTLHSASSSMIDLALMEGLLNSGLLPVAHFDKDLKIQRSNTSFCSLLRIGENPRHLSDMDLFDKGELKLLSDQFRNGVKRAFRLNKSKNYMDGEVVVFDLKIIAAFSEGRWLGGLIFIEQPNVKLK